ncbi:biotin transport system permease protein [Rhodoligotrophos appendicifer]|uniref:energy-coupling factor transporter transmembrane component T family protein n=1 Tax=Rhodoligotrophos appendicifer TaxID=987056 RepID=UPI00147960BA|nr:energy-coupling factor transporter transmembrane protein EcfT [Rhodoligotrophos appendicifer]
MITSLHVPGNTVLHRLPAGWKMGALCVSGILLFTLKSPLWLLASLGLSIVLLGVAQLRWDRIKRQMFGPAMILAFLFVATAALDSVSVAIPMALRLGTLILAAYVVTATTSTAEILDLVEVLMMPLERLHLAKAAHVALAVSLVIRFIPVLLAQAREIREAQAARGLERSTIALVVPLIVHALKSADDIAAAVDARCYPPGDGPS